MNSLPLEHSVSSIQRAKEINTANRAQAQLVKMKLKETGSGPKELFPEKIPNNQRRSDTFDATDATADLFAKKMAAPFLDGTGEAPPRNRDRMSRITKQTLEERITPADSSSRNSFNIRGTAEQHQDVGISIKGTAIASGVQAKELFPYKIGLNSGKELFAEKLEGRGARRRKAEDMFY
jgi:hypothetical protein